MLDLSPQGDKAGVNMRSGMEYGPLEIPNLLHTGVQLNPDREATVLLATGHRSQAVSYLPLRHHAVVGDPRKPIQGPSQERTSHRVGKVARAGSGQGLQILHSRVHDVLDVGGHSATSLQSLEERRLQRTVHLKGVYNGALICERRRENTQSGPHLQDPLTLRQPQSI